MLYQPGHYLSLLKDSVLVDMKDNALVGTLSSDVSDLSRYLSMDPQPRTQSLKNSL